MLLNNDTEVIPDFWRRFISGIQSHKNAFSCAARMLQFTDRTKIDDAGNFYNACGWAFARGKGKPMERYKKEERIFSSCGGAAIYRRELFVKKSDCLTRSILLIWKIRTLATGRR